MLNHMLNHEEARASTRAPRARTKRTRKYKPNNEHAKYALTTPTQDVVTLETWEGSTALDEMKEKEETLAYVLSAGMPCWGER